MDVRKDKWHGQLGVTGQRPRAYSGSVMSIVAESLKDLQSLNPRELADGSKEIVLRIRETPYPANKSESTTAMTMDILGDLDLSNESTGPYDGETKQSYQSRLIAEGTPANVAVMIAAEWFDS